jgi:flagellar motor switch protein FliG
MTEENKKPEITAPAPVAAKPASPAPALPAKKAILPEIPPGEKHRPFTYINYENIKRLTYLLRKESPQVGAVVLAYLKPEFTQRILAALPVDLKVSVIQESAKVRTLSPEQLMEIDARVKEKVDLVLGGWEQAAALLENADEKTRETIFERLRRENPMVYDKLKKTMFRFEDIPKIPSESMRIVIREVKNSSIATALHGASPEVVNKFRANMPPGGAQLLVETIQFSKPNPADVQKERKEIIQVIRHLEKEGQIFLDDEGSRSFLGDLEEEASPMLEVKPAARAVEAKPGSPGEAAQYLSAGVSHYEGGRFEQSLEYFQYALNCEPSLWQAHQYLGGAFYSLNRMAEARMHYEKLIQLHPDPALKEWYETFKKSLA